MDRIRVKRQGTKGAHGINQINFTILLCEITDLFNGVDNSGSCFAVHNENMGDAFGTLQKSFHFSQIRGLIFMRFMNNGFAARNIQNFFSTMAISAIDQQQNLALGRNKRSQHGLDRKSTRSLNRYGNKFFGGMSDLGQALQNRAVYFEKCCIAGTPVMHHDFFDGFGCCKRSGGQQ